MISHLLQTSRCSQCLFWTLVSSQIFSNIQNLTAFLTAPHRSNIITSYCSHSFAVQFALYGVNHLRFHSVCVCGGGGVWNCLPVDPQDPIKIYDKEIHFCCIIICVMSCSEEVNLVPKHDDIGIQTFMQLCEDSCCLMFDAFTVTKEAEQSFLSLLQFADRSGQSRVKRVQTQPTQKCVMWDYFMHLNDPCNYRNFEWCCTQELCTRIEGIPSHQQDTHMQC
jgi:hypothetical protein